MKLKSAGLCSLRFLTTVYLIFLTIVDLCALSLTPAKSTMSTVNVTVSDSVEHDIDSHSVGEHGHDMHDGSNIEDTVMTDGNNMNNEQKNRPSGKSQSVGLGLALGQLGLTSGPGMSGPQDTGGNNLNKQEESGKSGSDGMTNGSRPKTMNTENEEPKNNMSRSSNVIDSDGHGVGGKDEINVSTSRPTTSKHTNDVNDNHNHNESLELSIVEDKSAKNGKDTPKLTRPTTQNNSVSEPKIPTDGVNNSLRARPNIENPEPRSEKDSASELLKPSHVPETEPGQDGLQPDHADEEHQGTSPSSTMFTSTGNELDLEDAHVFHSEQNEDASQNNDKHETDERAQDFVDEEEGSGHFMAYFIVAVVLVVTGYLVYHNKQKILAVVLEGKRAAKRQPNGKEYRRLKTTVDEAMPSLDKSSSMQNYVY